jgi:hypothetical protein
MHALNRRIKPAQPPATWIETGGCPCAVRNPTKIRIRARLAARGDAGANERMSLFVVRRVARGNIRAIFGFEHSEKPSPNGIRGPVYNLADKPYYQSPERLLDHADGPKARQGAARLLPAPALDASPFSSATE